MADARDEIATLRLALADARRERDAAVAGADAAERRWREQRQEELHRLRNLFSVVRIIARRTGDEEQTVEDYRGTIDGRLSSYLGAHAAVARDWQRGSDLALLVLDQLLAFGLREGDRVEMVGPTISLTGRAAVILALAFHELAAAAIRSGRLVDQRRVLRVGWDFVEEGPDGGLTIDWVETVPEDHDAGDEERTSWAAWIEESIAHQLQGAFTTEDTGSGRRAVFRLPSSAVARGTH